MVNVLLPSLFLELYRVFRLKGGRTSGAISAVLPLSTVLRRLFLDPWLVYTHIHVQMSEALSILTSLSILKRPCPKSVRILS